MNHRPDEYLPHAIQREEIAQEVEVNALPRLRPLVPLSRVLQVVRLQEEVPADLLHSRDVRLQLGDVLGRHTRRRRGVRAELPDAVPPAASGRRLHLLRALPRLPLGERDALLLRDDDVDRLQQPPLHRGHVGGAHRAHEDHHRGVGIVDGAEAGQQRHDRHADDADPTQAARGSKDLCRVET